MADDRTSELAPAVRFVCLANLGYFFVEFGVALAISSVALFADSIDFLEDASVNFLILVALGWSAIARARVGMGLAALLLVPVSSGVLRKCAPGRMPLPLVLRTEIVQCEPGEHRAIQHARDGSILVELAVDVGGNILHPEIAHAPG